MGTVTSFAQRLKQAMQLRGIKQVELCQTTGIPKSAMSQYASGSFEPRQDRLTQLAEALQVNEAWLLGFDAPMELQATPPQDAELQEVLEYYKSKPGMKLLFSITKDATPEDIIKAAEIIEELKRTKNNGG